MLNIESCVVNDVKRGASTGNAAVEANAAPDEKARGVALPDVAPPELMALYRDYSPRLSATIRKMYGDGSPDPDDVAQEAFHRVIERGDISTIRNLKAFIWRTARNLVLKDKHLADMRSRHDFEIEQIYFPLKGDDSTPERIISAKEQLKAINDVLCKMPEKRRRAFILHRIEGLSIAEVGRRLGVGRTAAAKHVTRAAAELNAKIVHGSGS